MTDSDYVTVAPAVEPKKYCVLLMKYHGRDDEYLAVRSSQALPEAAAQALARSWAAALSLEVR